MRSKKKAVYGKAGRLSSARARDRPVNWNNIGGIFAKKWDWCRKKVSKADLKKSFLRNFPYFMFGYFGDKISFLYRSEENEDIFFRLMLTVEKMGEAFAYPIPSMQIYDLIFGIACGAALKIAVDIKKKNAKKFRHGEEYGSARWSA